MEEIVPLVKILPESMVEAWLSVEQRGCTDKNALTLKSEGSEEVVRFLAKE